MEGGGRHTHRHMQMPWDWTLSPRADLEYPASSWSTCCWNEERPVKHRKTQVQSWLRPKVHTIGAVILVAVALGFLIQSNDRRTQVVLSLIYVTRDVV